MPYLFPIVIWPLFKHAFQESKDGEDRVTLFTSIALESVFCGFYRTIFKGIETNYKHNDWLTTRRVILTTKNSEIEEINAVRRGYIPGEARKITGANNVEAKDKNAVRYAMEMLNTFSHGSAVLDHTLSLKKGFNMVILRNLDPKNEHLHRTR